MKTERLLGLIVLLLSRRQMTAKEMSQHFQVSQRTIYRDMITLENAGLSRSEEVHCQAFRE